MAIRSVAVMSLLFALCLPFGGRAVADESAAKARALFDSGLTHYNLAEYQAALTDFTEAYRVRRDPVFLFNIGQSQRQLGNHKAALVSYRNYLREAPNAPNRANVERFIAEAQAAIDKAPPPPAATVTPGAPPVAAPAATATDAPPPKRSGRGGAVAAGVIVGVVVVAGAGVGIGLGVGLSSSGAKEPSTALGTQSPVFP